MTKMLRKPDQGNNIKQAARELGIDEETLRNLINTVSDRELMEGAVKLVEGGRDVANVACNLGIDEESLRHWVRRKWETRRREEQLGKVQVQEEIRKPPPDHYLENPPS